MQEFLAIRNEARDRADGDARSKIAKHGAKPQSFEQGRGDDSTSQNYQAL